MSEFQLCDLQVFKPNGDSRWAYRFRVPDAISGPRRPMGRGFATRRAARVAAEARLESLLAAVPDESRLPTVSEIAADYRALRPGKGGGKTRLEWALTKIEDEFGARPIDEVSPRHADLWIASLRTESTRFEVSRVLRQLFTLAARHWDIKNPIAVARQPTRKEVKPFASVQELEQVAVELGEWGDVARFVAATGLRPEEWIPLEAGDIDEAAETVTIRRTYTEGKGLEQFIGKTAKSIRTVPLSAVAMAASERQRALHPDSPLIFPAPRGGYLNLANWRTRDWHPALEAAGVDARGPNALRHTFATWFLLTSDDRWLLAKLMGTGVDMIEQHYAHLVPPHADRARSILADMWQEFGRNLDANVTHATIIDRHEAVNTA